MVHIVISSPFKEEFTKRSTEIMKAEGKNGNSVYVPNFVDLGEEWEDTFKTQLDLAMSQRPQGKMLQLVIAGGLTDNQKMEASWARERRLEIDVQEMTLYLILGGHESKVINVIITPYQGRGAQKALEVAAANTDNRTITYNANTGSDALSGVMTRGEFDQKWLKCQTMVFKKVKETGGKAFVMMAGGTTMEGGCMPGERMFCEMAGISPSRKLPTEHERRIFRY